MGWSGLVCRSCLGPVHGLLGWGYLCQDDLTPVCGGWCWLLPGPLSSDFPFSRRLPRLSPLAVNSLPCFGLAGLELQGLLRLRLGTYPVSLCLTRITRPAPGQREGKSISLLVGRSGKNPAAKGHEYRDGRNSYCHRCKVSTAGAVFSSRVMNRQCLIFI